MMQNAMFDSYGPSLAVALHKNVSDAIAEDMGPCDLTGLLIDASARKHARVIVREQAVLCGVPWFEAVFKALDASSHIQWHVQEGAMMQADQVVCEIEANARLMLTAERPALNFLQLLSAVATKTRVYAACIADTQAKVLDTRKTVPGLRLAQKYAVVVGGGANQRLALYDGILIKENHIAAAGGIGAALQRAFEVAQGHSVQVEVENLDELREALAAGAQSVLLDNFDFSLMREAVMLSRQWSQTHGTPAAILEASGGVNLQTLRDIADTGVDRISVGGLTKDIKATDYSLRIID